MGTPAWTAHLAGTELFNTKNFPSMTFTSTQLAFEGDQVTGADGVLTMLGVTKPVHLDVSRFKCALHPQSQRPFCGCDVSATIRRSDFGLGKYLATVNDEVHIEAPVIAYRD
jgi:polyisoprenoid-binding protein YceI